MMKINPNELTQNKYRAVKSSDIDLKKESYTASTFSQDLKNKTLNKSKLRICKSSEKLENVEVVVDYEKSKKLEDIFKN